MHREDISENLIHLCKGVGDTEKVRRENAAATLLKIVLSKKLKGGIGYIKGEHTCICFSETPPKTLAQIISKKVGGKFKYQPYGIMFEKRKIYSLGGLPVIYSPESGYDKLHADHKHRHVTFDLSAYPPVDFTWEREWRYKTNEIILDPKEVWLVVPDAATWDTLSEELNPTWRTLVLSDYDVEVKGFQDC